MSRGEAPLATLGTRRAAALVWVATRIGHQPSSARSVPSSSAGAVALLRGSKTQLAHRPISRPSLLPSFRGSDSPSLNQLSAHHQLHRRLRFRHALRRRLLPRRSAAMIGSRVCFLLSACSCSFALAAPPESVWHDVAHRLASART